MMNETKATKTKREIINEIKNKAARNVHPALKQIPALQVQIAMCLETPCSHCEEIQRRIAVLRLAAVMGGSK